MPYKVSTVSTYYSWQRKVFQAVTAEPEVCFAEISAKPAGRGTAASIENGELRIDIHTGADMETVRAIIQSLKEYYIVSYSVKHPGKVRTYSGLCKENGDTPGEGRITLTRGRGSVSPAHFLIHLNTFRRLK